MVYFPVYSDVFALPIVIFFFFFSSRRRHTRCLSDWSSDVCSSDLGDPSMPSPFPGRAMACLGLLRMVDGFESVPTGQSRSEERRVGKECRARWEAYH